MWKKICGDFMKKILFLLSLFYFLCLGSASANSNIKVYLYDELIDMDNPIIVNGNTLVPLRVLFESLGSTITWDSQTKTAHATKGNTQLSIQIGNVNAINNGSTITLEEPAQIIDNKTYVPLRFVAESFNQDVNWDKDNNAIRIGKSLTAKDISKLAAPAVVYIEVNAYDGKNKSGSGFIVDKSGVVVTNYHVIDAAKSAKIKLIDGRVFDVTNVINYDVDRDLAIIKINSSAPFPTVTLADSDKVETGDKVFAIGSPDGFENTLSEGIISNKNQFFLNKRQFQITAQISHGSSGGALFNTHGEVIGVTDAGVQEAVADINFAIPINDYKTMYKENLNASFEKVYDYEHIINYTDALYVGDKKNNQPNGLGIMHWNNGDEYIGYFVNGVLNGKGKYTWSNGEEYDGDWVNGLRSGIGKHKIDGYLYEGQFSNNVATGKGILIMPNGDKYAGDFVNFKFNGYGTYTYSNGQVKQGYWVDGSYISTPTSTGNTPTGTSSTTPVTTIALSLYSSDGKTYLGKLTSNEFDLDSIFNSYGIYGSKYSINSIWNEFGAYGSKFSSTSAFNEFAFEPPVISDEKGNIIGRLTINTTISGAISPFGLKEALKKLGY